MNAVIKECPLCGCQYLEHRRSTSRTLAHMTARHPGWDATESSEPESE